jgi:hypothetical protein
MRLLKKNIFKCNYSTMPCSSEEYHKLLEEECDKLINMYKIYRIEEKEKAINVNKHIVKIKQKLLLVVKSEDLMELVELLNNINNMPLFKTRNDEESYINYRNRIILLLSKKECK